MSGHTPGPWIKDDSRNEFGDVYIYTKEDEFRVCAILGGDEYEDQHEANARLIAAAPELLEALQELMDINDNSGPFGGEMYHDRVDRAFSNARAAIAKATGSRP